MVHATTTLPPPRPPPQVLAIVNLRSDSSKAVAMRLTVRSSDATVSQFVASAVA